MITLSLDNGKTWQPAPDGVVVNFSDVDIPEIGVGDLQVVVDAEGVARYLRHRGVVIGSSLSAQEITDIVEELANQI